MRPSSCRPNRIIQSEQGRRRKRHARPFFAQPLLMATLIIIIAALALMFGYSSAVSINESFPAEPRSAEGLIRIFDFGLLDYHHHDHQYMYSPPSVVRFADAVAVCASGSTYSTTPYTITAANTYEALGCRLVGSIRFAAEGLTTTAVSSPSPSSTAVITVAGSTVAGGPTNSLGFGAPLAADAPLKGPLQITVRDTVFEQDAVLRLDGVLPPLSSFTVTGSSFYVTQVNTNNGVTTNLLAAVCIIINGLYTLPFSLAAGARIVVTDNTARGAVPIGAAGGYEDFTFVFIRGSSSTVTGAATLIDVSRNTMTVDQANQTFLMSFDADAGGVLLDQGANISVAQNTLRDVSTRRGAFIMVTYPRTSGYTVTNGALLTVSGNTMQNVRAAAATVSVMNLYTNDGYDLTIGGAARIVCEGNMMAGVYSPEYVRGFVISGARIALGASAALVIRATAMTNIIVPSGVTTGVPKAVGTVNLSPSISLATGANAQLIIDQNTITNAAATLLYHYLSIKSASAVPLTMADASLLSCSGNRFFSSTAAQSFFGCYFDYSSYALAGDSSRFLANNNGATGVSVGSANLLLVSFTPGTSVVIGGRNSTMSFSGNFMDGQSVATSNAYLVWITTVSGSTVTIAANCRFILNNNFITNVTATSASVGLVIVGVTDWVVDGPGAVLSVSNNSISSARVSNVNMVHFSQSGSKSISLVSGGSFLVQDNALRSSAIGSQVVMLATAYAISVRGADSTYSVARSVLYNTTSPRMYAYLTSSSGSTLILVEGGGLFEFANNSALNCNAATGIYMLESYVANYTVVGAGSRILFFNTTVANSWAQFVHGYGMSEMSTGTMTVAAGGAFRVFGNHFYNLAVTSNLIIIFNRYAAITLNGANSQWLIVDNSLRNCGAVGVFLLYLTFANGISASGSGALFSLSNNVVFNVTSRTDQWNQLGEVVLNSVALSNTAVAHLSNNSVSGGVVGAGVYLYYIVIDDVGGLTLSGSSSFLVTNNSFGTSKSATESVNIEIIISQMVVDGTSIVRFEGNTLYDCAAGNTVSKAVSVLANSLSIGGGSVVSISNNTVRDLTLAGTSSQQMFGVRLNIQSTSTTVSGASSLIISQNIGRNIAVQGSASFYNIMADFATAEAVPALIVSGQSLVCMSNNSLIDFLSTSAKTSDEAMVMRLSAISASSAATTLQLAGQSRILIEGNVFSNVKAANNIQALQWNAKTDIGADCIVRIAENNGSNIASTKASAVGLLFAQTLVISGANGRFSYAMNAFSLTSGLNAQCPSTAIHFSAAVSQSTTTFAGVFELSDNTFVLATTGTTPIGTNCIAFQVSQLNGLMLSRISNNRITTYETGLIYSASVSVAAGAVVEEVDNTMVLTTTRQIPTTGLRWAPTLTVGAGATYTISRNQVFAPATLSPPPTYHYVLYSTTPSLAADAQVYACGNRMYGKLKEKAEQLFLPAMALAPQIQRCVRLTETLTATESISFGESQSQHPTTTEELLLSTSLDVTASLRLERTMSITPPPPITTAAPTTTTPATPSSNETSIPTNTTDDTTTSSSTNTGTTASVTNETTTSTSPWTNSSSANTSDTSTAVNSTTTAVTLAPVTSTAEMTSTSPAPTNATAPSATPFPELIIDLAPPNVDDDLFGLAAAEGNAAALTVPIVVGTCRRLEALVSARALLAPLLLSLDDWADRDPMPRYQDALLMSLIGLAVVVGLLAVVTVPVGALLLRGGKRVEGAGTSALASAFFTVRFPATAIQCFVFVANGAAVSAGMVLGGGGSDGAGVAPGAVTAVILVLCPVVLAVAVERVVVPSAKRSVAVAPEGTLGGSAGTADDEDGLRRYTEGEGVLGLELRCGVVRPVVEGRLMGPLVGDLRVQHAAAPLLVPFAMPLVLLCVSAGVGASGSCELLPLIAGILYIVYAVIVAISQPFLGMTHNAVEAVASLGAGVCLIGLWSAYDPDGGAASSAELGWLLGATSISNARYPFIVARLLDVVLPPVMAVRRLPRVGDDGDDASSTTANDAAAAVSHRVLSGEAVDEGDHTAILLLGDSQPEQQQQKGPTAPSGSSATMATATIDRAAADEVPLMKKGGRTDSDTSDSSSSSSNASDSDDVEI